MTDQSRKDLGRFTELYPDNADTTTETMSENTDTTFTKPTNPANQTCANCGRFRPDLNEGDSCRICQHTTNDTHAHEETVENADEESGEISGNCPECGAFASGNTCDNCGFEA